jgi:hypothetical protein
LYANHLNHAAACQEQAAAAHPLETPTNSQLHLERPNTGQSVAGRVPAACSAAAHSAVHSLTAASCARSAVQCTCQPCCSVPSAPDLPTGSTTTGAACLRMPASSKATGLALLQAGPCRVCAATASGKAADAAAAANSGQWPVIQEPCYCAQPAGLTCSANKHSTGLLHNAPPHSKVPYQLGALLAQPTAAGHTRSLPCSPWRCCRHPPIHPQPSGAPASPNTSPRLCIAPLYHALHDPPPPPPAIQHRPVPGGPTPHPPPPGGPAHPRGLTMPAQPCCTPFPELITA